MKRSLVALAVIALAWSAADAQKRPAPPKTPRLYIFDNGDIAGLDPKIFGFAKEELKSVDFVNQSYLIVHPRGTVMFDTGGVGDDKFPAGGGVAKEGIMTASKKLVPTSAGTLPTHGALFVGLLVSTVVVVGALTFFPALSLAPIVEHFLMYQNKLFSLVVSLPLWS